MSSNGHDDNFNICSGCQIPLNRVTRVWNSLAELGKSPQAVQELSAAALVEVQSRQGRGRVLHPEDQEGPAFFPHCDGPELTDIEGQRPPAPLVAVVQRT